MSEEPKKEELDETEGTEGEDAESESGPATSRPPPSILTRPTDHAQRPGFRSPSNARSKAQKKKKNKRKKR